MQPPKNINPSVAKPTGTAAKAAANEGAMILDTVVEIVKRDIKDDEKIRTAITRYASIERCAALYEVLEIPIDMHTTLADFCAKVRQIAQKPYRAG